MRAQPGLSWLTFLARGALLQKQRLSCCFRNVPLSTP